MPKIKYIEHTGKEHEVAFPNIDKRLDGHAARQRE